MSRRNSPTAGRIPVDTIATQIQTARDCVDASRYHDAETALETAVELAQKHPSVSEDVETELRETHQEFADELKARYVSASALTDILDELADE